jgi:hypothetical protein
VRPRSASCVISGCVAAAIACRLRIFLPSPAAVTIAFGAGLLNAWTERGDRPSFKLVTGVSTGSLSAPFAFLGAAYDASLREAYTGVGPDDIFRQRDWVAIPFSDGIADSAPLARMIARYVDTAMLAAIAAEYAKGRLLLISTTNLDV